MAKVKNIAYGPGQMVLLVLAGLLSGAAGYYIGNVGPLILLIVPGLLFGLMITFVQYILFGKKFSLKSLVFIGISTVSYFIAVNIYWGLSWSANQGNSILQSEVALLFIGSFVGTFLFLLGYRIISTFSLISFILLTIWGVFLSLAFFGSASINSAIAYTSDKQLLSGFMLWQGGMALSLGLITRKKIQNAKIVTFIILVLGLIEIAILRVNIINTMMEKTSMRNDYQKEVDKLVSANFTLVRSTFENKDLKVGTVLTDAYRTHLKYNQAMAIIQAHASNLGYLTPFQAQCFGGVEYNSDHGTIGICETAIKNGVTTFEITLTNYSKVKISQPLKRT